MNIRVIALLLIGLQGCQAVEPRQLSNDEPKEPAALRVTPNCQVLGGVYRCAWIEPAGSTRTLML